MSLLIASASDAAELLLIDVRGGSFHLDGRIALPSPPQVTVAHPLVRVAYAASWAPYGGVVAIDFAEGAPRLMGPPHRTGGRTPCSLAVDPSGRTLCVADYDGEIATFALDRSGAIDGKVGALTLPGSGADAERQRSTHPHHLHFEPEAAHVVVVDLGADRVRRLPFDSGTQRLHAPAVDSGRAPAGAGPRSAAPVGDGRLIVANELDATVSMFDLRGDGYHHLAAADVSRRGADRDYPSDIAVTPDGMFAFVADRGADVIAVFRIGRVLERVAEVASGAWPMSLAMEDHVLYCASRDAGLVRSWRGDAASGALMHSGDYPVPSPVNVASVPW